MNVGGTLANRFSRRTSKPGEDVADALVHMTSAPDGLGETVHCVRLSQACVTLARSFKMFLLVCARASLTSIANYLRLRCGRERRWSYRTRSCSLAKRSYAWYGEYFQSVR